MEEDYHTIFNHLYCGIFLCDRNGIILDANARLEKIIGHSRNEILHTDFRKFISPDEIPYITLQFQKVFIEKHAGPFVGNIKQQSGQLIEVEFFGNYLEKAYQSPCAVFTLNEMTHRNAASASGVLSDKLAIVAALSASIIHEVNNPMTWILTNLSYMKEKIKLIKVSDPSQEVLLKKLDEVSKESIQGAERVRDIVQDLKKFIGVDQEQTTLVNVHDEIESAIHRVLPNCKDLVKIETHYEKQVPVVLLSTARLKQVFINVLLNAIEAMDPTSPEKNLITVTTSLAHNKIYIDIQDTGKGISSDKLSRIFEPFFTTKHVGVGTGLGLFVCNEIIQKAGGKITITSLVGKGTLCRLELPIQLNITHEEALAPASNEMSRKRILVVDDEPTLLMVIKRILEKNHDIVVCDGKAAIAHLSGKEKHFDCIITDLNMPDVNGMDIYHYVSQSMPGLEKYIIFTTGGTDMPVTKDFLAGIKNSCLEKPFTPEQLKQTLTHIFNKMEK